MMLLEGLDSIVELARERVVFLSAVLLYADQDLKLHRRGKFQDVLRAENHDGRWLQ